MSRLIFLVIIICLVVYFFKKRTGKASNKNSSPANSENVESAKEAEDMVQCTTCQVHLPRSEAFLVADNFYCCQAHIQKK